MTWECKLCSEEIPDDIISHNCEDGKGGMLKDGAMWGTYIPSKEDEQLAKKRSIEANRNMTTFRGFASGDAREQLEFRVKAAARMYGLKILYLESETVDSYYNTVSYELYGESSKINEFSNLMKSI